MLKKIKETIRVQSSPYGAIGKAEWSANLNSENSVELDMNLPGNRVLKSDDVLDVHLAKRIPGWKNPRELGKTALVTAASFFGGGVVLESIGEGEELLRGLIAMMSLSLPPGYGAYTLSRKTVRLLVTTVDGNVVVELPEYLAMLIIGVFSETDDPKPDDVAESATEALV